VVRDLAKMVRPVIGERIELQLQLGKNIGVVHGDPGELQQALLNLCLNARDAMSSSGRLVIRTDAVMVTESYNRCGPAQAPGDYVIISVSDTGCGMAPEVRRRIFEPFYTTKEIGKGTGLGLSKVFGVVQQHGGTIHVHSEPGKGSTFEICLPTVSDTVEADTADISASISGGTETLLLADDEPLVRKFMSRVLSEAGYRVIEASDGEEAVRLYREYRAEVALALLDLVMPGLNGHEVYKEISSDAPDLKVVFCTGYEPGAAVSDHTGHAGPPLLEKPFESNVLLQTVRSVLSEEGQCLTIPAN
jgi:CheY-like chemotaxis protein